MKRSHVVLGTPILCRVNPPGTHKRRQCNIEEGEADLWGGDKNLNALVDKFSLASVGNDHLDWTGRRRSLQRVYNKKWEDLPIPFHSS